jgi:hypothetical protein
VAPPHLSGGRRPPFEVIDQLCRMQLHARRLGCTIRVHEADAPVRELIELFGLGDLLLGTAGCPSSAEGPGQAEQVEEGRLQEDVDPDDGGR